MKKIALLFFLLLFLTIIIINEPLQSISVFEEENSYLQYQEDFITTYEIDFSDLQVTTSNIENYFDQDIEVLSLEPMFSEIVKKKIKKEIFYFNYGSDESNIKRMVRYYQDELRNNGFTKELIQVDYVGIRIKSMRVRTTKKVLENLQNKETNIHYRLLY